MIIKSIRYKNFRNFANEGKIDFDTEGKMTIIYGTNGDGKTTLHQLFQWILYEKVTFNNTTSANKLYNLEIGEKLLNDCSMTVMGEIEFTHNGVDYVVRREWVYFKNKSGVITRKTDKDAFYVQKKNDLADWKTVENPELVIEEVIPSGLSPYFFFDGETMIADLKIRGTESAKMLRTALYSIFELQVYENAVRDIGSVKKLSTALGKLENKRLEEIKKSSPESTVQQYLRDVKVLKAQIESMNINNEMIKERVEEYKNRISAISEEIGSRQSEKVLERSRGLLKESIKREEDNIKTYMLEFGKELETNYSHLLITEVVKNADKRLYLQVQDEEKRIIPGLSKELLINLLKNNENKTCICGNCVGDKEKNEFEKWMGCFPPASYKAAYDSFKRDAIRFSGKYSKDNLSNYIAKIVSSRSSIRKYENQIDEISSQYDKAGNVDDLLKERNDKEKQLKEWDTQILHNTSEIGNCEHQLSIRNKKIDSYKKTSGNVDIISAQIEDLEQIKNYIQDKLVEETKEYSDNLKNEIQFLINTMLTSKREVSLSEEFQLQVKDSHGDESKSEGQFAVVSFAYIGGILKVLKGHDKLKEKEYPLILDGPFSKLDVEQKKNVINTIPQYAPQVVIFSKDSLEDFVDKHNVGKVYTICSNDEKNKAEVKEGYLWK